MGNPGLNKGVVVIIIGSEGGTKNDMIFINVVLNVSSNATTRKRLG